MRRFVILFVFVAACSSSTKRTPPTTSTALGSTSTTTTTTAPASTTTTTSVPPPASVARITNFSGPASVQCNAPTSVELTWTTTDASEVALHIDGGPVFARYPNGAQDQLEPLTCDGKSHTYTIVATDARGVAATKSLTISTQLP